MSVIGIIENLLNNEPWTDGALCTQVDRDLFFPEHGESSKPARRICQRCDVREECLNFALTHGEKTGVWGGMSARQRSKLLRSA